MFFRITAVRPVQIHRFRCPHPSHSRLEPTGSRVSSAFLVPTYTRASRYEIPRPAFEQPPASGRARPGESPRDKLDASTCHRDAPSGSAAGASRHPLGQTPGVLVLLRLSVSPTSSHPGLGWNGERISRPRLRRSWRTRHPGRTPLRRRAHGTARL